MKNKPATIFVSGNECLFLSTSFPLAIPHDVSVPIIVGTMNNNEQLCKFPLRD